MMRVVIAKSANLVESRVKNGKGRVLDIGCGYGFFLQEMKSRGWEVSGIEISEVGREYTRDKWAIPIHSQPLEDIALSSNDIGVKRFNLHLNLIDRQTDFF